MSAHTIAGVEIPPRPRVSRGFTLVELMIVVVVIGILAAIAIPNLIVMQSRAKEGSTKSNMHTVQLAAEDYGIQNDGVYSATMDGAHIVPQLPPNFQNPFNSTLTSWEDRGTFAADPSATTGIVSYADSATTMYNVKGYGKAAPLTLVLTSGK
jgi:prepilin-type N-terminal cleavage/methylation domain-containing protein